MDSSLDWGQDLPSLHTWLEAHAKTDQVYLSYCGEGSPIDQGIVATRFGDAYFDRAPNKMLPVLRGGVYCISATMLHRVYSHMRGPWSPSYESSYQELLGWHRQQNQSADNQPKAPPLSANEINERRFMFEQLQYGRLCHYFENRPPDAWAGRSILIYRLSDADVRFALEAPLDVVNAALKSSQQ